MTKHFLLISLLFIYFFPTYSQENKLEYRITYELRYQPDSTDSGKIRTEPMWLFAGSQASLFLSKGQALKDSLSSSANIAMLGTEHWKQKASATKSAFSFRIFKDVSENKIYHGEKIFQDKLFYTEPKGQISWNILPESQEIFGYSAQKASTSFAGRDYTAWFTTEIPIPDGPYKFSGLPGLILKLEDSEQEYVFSFVGLEKLYEPMQLNIPPADYQEADKVEIFELKQRFEEDPIKYVNNYVGPGGKRITIKADRSQKKNLKDRREADKNQNPIELK
ncbi:GLPGLI family protein [Gramella sp. GC03-9]|uniref:GLPGLI family protein n=1 Tax=Christiangramia oceanisediminis TaxID=2920386 RepID=A0A9X2IA80_9FLAO|nr:GLPGLI family protein [Gramella oceanisediminis]MCP9198903.1 GLPGLI family protein [Gramella oceanisediminis]